MKLMFSLVYGLLAYIGFIENVELGRYGVYGFMCLGVAVASLLLLLSCAATRSQIVREAIVKSDLENTKVDRIIGWGMFVFMSAIIYISGHTDVLWIYLGMTVYTRLALGVSRSMQRALKLTPPTTRTFAGVRDVTPNKDGVYE